MITKQRVRELWNEEFERAKEMLVEIGVDTGDVLPRLVKFDFKFGKAKHSVGTCKYKTHTIEISEFFLHSLDEEETRETLRHELAHAMVGGRHGHNDVWRGCFQWLGGRGERQAPRHVDIRPEDYLWRLECAVTGKVLGRVNRRGRRLDNSVCACHDQYPIWIKQR